MNISRKRRLTKIRRQHSRFSKAAAMLFFIGLMAALMVSQVPQEATAAHTFIPRRDVAAQDSVDVEIVSDSLNLESGHELPLTITVTHLGYPVPGAVVNVVSTAENVCTFRSESETTDVNGQMVVFLLAVSDEDICVDVTATAYVENYTIGTFILRDIAIEPAESFLDGAGVYYMGIGGAMAIIAIGATETGKYALLKLLVVPLYSRVKREDVLDHFVRGQIFGHVMSHPGAHYNAIKQALKVNNGTLSHHLKTLEMQGYLNSHRDGTYKRLYPTGQQVPRRKGRQLSDLQMCILDAIKKVPGLTQKDLATEHDISQQSVSYNIRALVRIGALSSRRDGISKRYFIDQEM